MLYLQRGIYKKAERHFASRALPAILSDIDGVVYRGGHEIGNSRAVIQSLINHRIDGHRVPFALLTNGGGIPEQERAELVNSIIGLKEESGALKGEDMILCHSPFRAKELVERYRDKYVLVSGLGRMIDIAELYGYKKAIDIEELFALYPYLSPVTHSHKSNEFINQKKSQLLNRLNKSEKELKKELQFHAIMLLSDGINIDLNIQLFCDILASKDGRVGVTKRGRDDPQFVKLYLSNPDLIYADKHNVPRHGQGILIHCLKQTFQSVYGFDNLDYTMYGKPERLTFDYAESLFLDKAEKQGIQITNYYMIGDNPEGDIEGANRKGWNSILVRTGLFKEGENSKEHPAKYVVQDMHEAARLISDIEGLGLRF